MTQKSTVLITGCSSGIGNATAKHFAAQDWNVIATTRSGQETQDLMNSPNVFITRLDVQDPASIAAALDAGIARFGRIDTLINNAGFGLQGIFEATPKENILKQFEVNVFGVMDVVRAILPHLREHGGGVILNVSSGAGIFTLPLMSLYCASKFALEGFSEGLAWEVAPQNIMIKLIEPGGVPTTKFLQKTAEIGNVNKNPPAYDGFLEKSERFFGQMISHASAQASDVAAEIYQAATDGTDQLRYVVTDDIKPLITLRHEAGEAQYIATLRTMIG